MYRPTHCCRDLLDGEVVDVSKGQHESVGRRQLAKEFGDTIRDRGIEIVELLVGGVRSTRPDESHPTLLALRTSIVIDQLVASDADCPRHRLKRGVAGAHRRNDRSERLLGQVFGKYPIAQDGATQVSIDLIECLLVELSAGIKREVR
jgi:hypothetical protein